MRKFTKNYALLPIVKSTVSTCNQKVCSLSNFYRSVAPHLRWCSKIPLNYLTISKQYEYSNIHWITSEY